MAKLLSVILILSIAANTAGYIVVFGIRQDYIKSTAIASARKADIKKTEILKIGLLPDGKLPPDLKRVKKHEILYRGKMYDIKHEEVRNDTLFVYCIHDKKEDNLIKSFAKLFDDSNSHSGKGRLNLKKSYKLINFEIFFTGKTIPVLPFSDLETGNFYSEKFISHISDIPEPPPRLIS